MMAFPNHSEGGVQATRGFHFQTYALLFYFLVRRLEFPDLDIIIEPSQGEDAQITYLVHKEGNTQTIVELVQCKKRESSHDSSAETENFKADDWKEGEITPHRFGKWLKEKRPHLSAVDILEANESAYYTAIVFGEISKGLKPFIPKGLPQTLGFTGYWFEFSSAFPVDFKHSDDPLKSQPSKRAFGTADVRSRVRLLRFSSPAIIEHQCRFLLEAFYGVSKRLSFDTVEALAREIRKREASIDHENRRLSPSDIETLIAAGLTSQGRWLESRAVLQHEEKTPSDWNKSESARWIDYESNRFVLLDEYEEARNGLERHGFIVISGPAGVGKTTLSKYLAYRFEKEEQGRISYFLRIRDAESLEDEIQFLVQRMNTDTLFVVDDQHIAPDQVEKLVTVFADYYDQGTTQAKFVITTSTTYGRTQNASRGRAKSVLNRMPLVPLLPLDGERMTRVASELIDSMGLQTPLSAEELALWSQGNIGLAMILSHCSQKLNRPLATRKLLESKVLKQALVNWILTQVGRIGDNDYFHDQIVPLFTLGSYELPIPGDFTNAVEALHEVGFLELDEHHRSSDSPIYFVANHKLAKLVNIQFNSQEFFVCADYLKQCPKHSPILCERLAYSSHGQSILKSLCEEHLDHFIAAITDPDEPISLEGLSRILRSVDRTGRRSESLRLLRALASPRGYFHENFFASFINIRRTTDLASVTSFFDAINKIDRYRIRDMAKLQLADQRRGEPLASFIFGLFALESSQLDDIASCLRAIGRCSTEFAATLYRRLKESTVFSQKVAQVDSSSRDLFIWLRFCEGIKQVDRNDSHYYLARRLTIPKVQALATQISEFNRISFFLLRLQRLNPKLVAHVFSTLWEDDLNRLEALLKTESDLTVLMNDLYILSRLDRRLAYKTAHRLKGNILGLLHTERRYDKIGSAINNLRRVVGVNNVSEFLSTVNRQEILAELKVEKQRFALVGRFLSSLAEVSPELASWFEERLDYRTYTLKVHDLVIYNYVHIICGFLAASATKPDHRDAVLTQILNDSLLVHEFNREWVNSDKLIDRAFCLSQLMDSSLSKPDIIQLLGFPNLASFEEEALKAFQRAYSVIDITNGLFAIAKFDLDIASQALQRFIQQFNLETDAKQEDRAGPSRRPGYRRRKLPQGYQPDDLVDVGSLLRISAAIDLPQARTLAGAITLETFAQNAANEANYGRLAVFVLGLLEASRKYAFDFVDLTSSEKFWSKQYEENERIENVIHFARALASVSRTKSKQFVAFIIERYRDEIITQLELEANLALVSNWLRILPVCGAEFAHENVAGMYASVVSTAEYDSRLRNLIETTEALVECNHLDLAKSFANRAVAECSQIKAIRKLRDWIVIFHKVARISRALKLPDLPRQLFSKLDTWYFFGYLVAFETQPLLLAYTYRLLQTTNVLGFEDLRNEITHWKPQIISAARSERRVVLRSLSLVLAGAQYDEIADTADSDGWSQPWERGLTALVFSSLFPGDKNPFVKEVTTDDDRADLLSELNEHTGNVEFGLTLRLAALSDGTKDLLEQVQTIVNSREAEEYNSVTRFLLKAVPGDLQLDASHYYLWSLLRSTVLRATYLAWESELIEEAHSAALEQNRTRRLEPILA